MLTGTDIITVTIITTIITTMRIRMAMGIPTIMSTTTSTARKVSSITAKASPASMFLA